MRLEKIGNILFTNHLPHIINNFPKINASQYLLALSLDIQKYLFKYFKLKCHNENILIAIMAIIQTFHLFFYYIDLVIIFQANYHLILLLNQKIIYLVTVRYDLISLDDIYSNLVVFSYFLAFSFLIN